MLELGDNAGITLGLSSLLRKTSKGKVSAKYKFLAMETQFSDQKRWSVPLKPASHPKGSKERSDLSLEQILLHLSQPWF